MNFAIIAAITIAIYVVSLVLNFLMIIAMVVIDPKTDEDIHTMHVNADASVSVHTIWSYRNDSDCCSSTSSYIWIYS